ncbi:MAG: Maf family nucleotide pyrophosphatase [Sulfuricellaceae bacterium]|nr:Maf family nucleotide pyrophosphatase [Sulfuricellaceae bacterium]
MATGSNRIYLVSRSPRRRELLKQIGIVPEPLLLRSDLLRPADVDETPYSGEPVEDYVRRIARAKAETGWAHLLQRRLPKLPILAADTTIGLDGEIIGKPDDREHAEAILRRLSGRMHEVLTCVTMVQDEHIEERLAVSRVEFKALSEDEIKRYAASGEPFDKAGAYAIQGLAAIFVARLEGSYSGVMGLPLFETAQLLELFGVEHL